MQKVNHRYMQWIVAVGVGLILAFYAFERSTDPEPTRRKAFEESLVMHAREILTGYVLPGGELQLVDPLAPDRKVGKVYVWPNEAGWQVSGHYRRDATDRWHPYLLQLDEDSQFVSLSVRDTDARLLALAERDERFSAVP